MPLTADQQAAFATALNRLANFYDGDHAYNPATYPGAMRQFGSVVNFVPALKDVATVMQLASVLVADATAASGASPKALRVDGAQAFLPAERGTGRGTLKLEGSSYAYSSGNRALTKDDVGTTFYVDATQTITLPLLSDCVVGDRFDFYVNSGSLTLVQPAGNANPIGTPGGGAQSVTLTAGAYSVKSHGTAWRIHAPPAPPAVDLTTRVAKAGDTMSGTLAFAGGVNARFQAPATANASAADWSIRGIAGNRLQLTDGGITIEYASFGPDGTFSTRQMGDVKSYIDTKFPSASFTPGNIYGTLNAGYAISAGPYGGFAYRDGYGRCQFTDSLNYNRGYCLVNGDGRIGGFTIQDGYIQISVDGGGNFYGITINASDARLKENIIPVGRTDESGKIDRLEFISFDWKEGAPFTGHRSLGIVAQDAKKIEPEWIFITADDKHQPDVYRMLISTMRALQESNARGRDLEARIARLEGL